METSLLEKKLLKYGTVVAIKADTVFTLLLTGENLSKGNTVMKISTDVCDFVGSDIHT